MIKRTFSFFQCIVEKASKEKVLPALEKVKYLTPSEMTMGSFTSVIR